MPSVRKTLNLEGFFSLMQRLCWRCGEYSVTWNQEPYRQGNYSCLLCGAEAKINETAVIDRPLVGLVHWKKKRRLNQIIMVKN
jgi:hypothetical protein